MIAALPQSQIDAIVAEALSWERTPYQHQASLKHYGADCLGLIRGVWRALYGDEPEPLPPYTPHWAEERGEETLYKGAARYLTQIELTAAQPGDVILFRMEPTSPAKHAAIRLSPERIIHAYWGRAVTQSLYRPYWHKRAAFAFRFPPLKDNL